MPDKIEDTRGLQHCYWRENGKLYSLDKGMGIYLNTENKNEFVVDERCVGGKTTNPKHTIENARWAFIYDVFFQSLEKAKSGDITDNLWGPLSGGKIPVSKYGLGLKYKVGGTFLFNPSGYSYYYGFKQRVELFSESPGTGFYFYVIPVTKSNICYAYFNKSEDVKRYGDFANLEIMLHGYNLDKKNKYRGKLYLLEEDKAKGLTGTDDFKKNNLWKEPKVFAIPQDAGSSSNCNSYYKTSFPIEIAWKKDQKAKKNFTVVLEIYKYHTEPGLIYGTNEKEERVVFRNFADEPTTDLVTYDAKVLGLKDIDNKSSISSRFIVSEELMTDFLDRIEAKKVNQIQYIGDIRYTRKEFDPCGYSKIVIKDDGDKERSAFTCFDEDLLTTGGDKTGQPFSIIAGEKRKDVSITVENLHNKNVPCNGLLLPSGQKHDSPNHVFLLDRAIAAEKTDKGYTTIKDPTQENDTDVIPDKNKAPSEDVSEVQVLQSEFKGDNQIVLKLNYIYNKVWLERSLGDNAASEFMWMFNYFWLNDSLAQSYYLPVSTCRYPNQIAKINVYPDMEWEFSLKLSSDTPEVYSHTNMPTGVTSRQNRIKTLTASNNRRFLNGEVSFDLAIKAKSGDFTREISGGYAAKIEPFLRALIKVKETLDDITGVTKAKNGMAAKLASKLPIKMLPITFQMDYPVISIAGTWKLEPDKEKIYNVRRTGTISLGFTPLIKGTGKLDLIACAEFIPAAGQVIKAIRTAADVAGIEIWFNLLAFGQIDLKANITLGQEYGMEPLEASTTVGIGAELGIKAAADVPKISFNSRPSGEGLGVEFEASARGETSLIFSGKTGASNEGMYVEAGIGFGGLLVYVTAKAKIWRAKVGVDNEAHELVEPKPDMLKGRYYYIKNK